MKNILIINGEPFQDFTATGITLKNIFGSIPKENMKFIHLSKMSPDLKYLDNVFSYYKDSVEIDIAEQLSARNENKINKHLKISEAIKNELRIWNDLRKIKFSDNITNYIKDSNAQIIYTCLGNLRTISLVLYAQKILNCKVVPHFMDDWKSVIFQNKRFLIHKSVLQNKIKLLFKNVTEGIAISETMAIQYQKEFRVPFQFIMNSIPDEHISTLQKNGNSQIKRFVFTGGLHLNRWKSLLKLVEGFELLCTHYEFIIEIYCPENDKTNFMKYFEKYKFVHFRGHLPSNEVNGILKTADAFIHCESFDKYLRKYTRLSISTKIPLYLKEGKLLLAYGPEEIESVQYINRNQAGIVLSDENPRIIAQSIDELLSEYSKINIFANNALILARKNHSYSSVILKLNRIFS